MGKLKILVVEDDALARKIMSAQLGEHDADFAPDLATARHKIAAGRSDICFIDLDLGDGKDHSGLELIPIATAAGSYSVVMSGHDSEAVVERAYQLGCDDFYAKGNEAENVGAVIARFLRRRQQKPEDRLFQDQFVTADSAMRASITAALKHAESDLPILILGPSGTGKTSLAKIIHERSGREGEFVAINCASYTEDLLEAELFGHRKGAFTGASESRKGKLLAADKGTLFLDEIGAMSPKMQAKLLKAIEEKSFYPLGSDRPVQSRFRVVSATLEDLGKLVEEGRFRFDLLQRIQGLSIRLKALAERKDDISALVGHFTRGGRRLSFSPEAKSLILEYAWPGNVRELKKCVELLAAGDPGRVEAASVRGLLDSPSTSRGRRPGKKNVRRQD